MGNRIGSHIVGTQQIDTSIANQEIVQAYKPSNWNIVFSFYRLSFRNLQACTVEINNGDPIYLDAEQGIETNEVDVPIYDFKIVEPDIQYQFIAGY